MANETLRQKLAKINIGTKAIQEKQETEKQKASEQASEQAIANILAPLPEELAMDAAAEAASVLKATIEVKQTETVNQVSDVQPDDNERPKFHKIGVDDVANDSIASIIDAKPNDELAEDRKETEQSGNGPDVQVETKPSRSSQFQKGLAKLKKTVKKQDEETVEPKPFQVMTSHMGLYDSYTVMMQLKDLKAYTQLEQKLLGKNDKEFKALTLAERVQRKIDTNRVGDIARYLIERPSHWFPAIVAVPSSPEQVAAFEAVNGTNQVMIDSHGVSVIDGQHRVSGIIDALVQLEADVKVQQSRLAAKQSGNASEADLQVDVADIENDAEQAKAKLDRIASSTIPIMVVGINFFDEGGPRAMKQLFVDVNMNMKKTSRILNVNFDSELSSIVLAHKIADLFPTAIDTEHASPSKAGHYVCSIVNLVSLMQPNSKMKSSIMYAYNNSKLASTHQVDDDIVQQLGAAIINKLPESKQLIDMTSSVAFQNVSDKYVCYSGASWIALGKVIDWLVSGKKQIVTGETDEDGEEITEQQDILEDVKALPVIVDRFMELMLERGNWSMTSRFWLGKLTIVDGKRVINQQGPVNLMTEKMKAVMEDVLKELE